MNLRIYLILIIILIVARNASLGQGVGVNNSGAQPDPSSILDVESTDRGILIPRLALTATNVSTPVTSPATSLLVYNTATSGSGGTAVTPGFYYWNGTQWTRVVSGSIPTGSDDQNLTGATLTGTTLQIDIENGTSTSVDLSGLQDGTGTDDQNLTLTGTNLAIEDGNTVDLSGLQDGTGTDDQNLTLTGTNLAIENGNTVDLSGLQDGTGTDDQNLTGATLTGTTLQIDIENGTSTSVNLSGLQDGTGTDDQNLTLTGTNLAIENGNTVDLSGLQDGTGTDDQNLTGATLTGTTLQIDIENGTSTSVNLSGLQDGTGTDDQNITLTGTNLAIENGNTVDLSGLQDGTGTDDQNLTGATLTGTTLQIDIENGTSTSVNLSGLQDGTGTDDQNLTLTGTNLAIENGNTVDLSGLQDGTGTDDQNLTGATLTGTTLQIDIENGTSTSVNLSGLQDGTGTDDQNLTLTGTNLAIENGNTVDLSGLQDGTGTDDQNLTGATLTGTTLQIDIENGTSTSVDLSGLQDGVTDADSDPTNEYNTSVVLNGTDLEVTDGNGTITTDLSSLSAGSDDWKTLGNAGTIAGTNFIGTTDNRDVEFRRFNARIAYFGYAGSRMSFGLNAGMGNGGYGFGNGALESVGSARYNFAFGAESMNTLINEGDDNIGIGYRTLYTTNGPSSTSSSDDNLAIGSNALFLNEKGLSNIGIGHRALATATGAPYDNIGIGYKARSNANGSFSPITIGAAARYGSNIASSVAIGARAVPSGSTNGVEIGYACVGKGLVGYIRNSVVVGAYAGYSLYSASVLNGRENVAVGNWAMKDQNTGRNCTQIGYYSTSLNNNLRNSTSIGANSTISSNNQIRFGDASVNSIGGFANWTNVSDERFKVDIKENVPGIEFITKLHPVTYFLDVKKINQFLGISDSLVITESVKGKSSILQTGFIAQEVDEAAKELNYDFSGVDRPDNEKDHFGLRYAEFVVPLVKAIQEQQDIIKEKQSVLLSMKEDNYELYKELDLLLEQIKELERSSINKLETLREINELKL